MTIDNRELDRLVEVPREDIAVEYKQFLDIKGSYENRAILAKAILALANSGGGFVVFGFKEVTKNLEPDIGNENLGKTVDQDLVNSIVSKFAEPAFHCRVEAIHRKDGSGPFPIVQVPGGHAVPVMAKAEDKSDAQPQSKHVRQNQFYIRKPGPKSEPITSADEWRELLDRCIRARRVELADLIRDVVLGVGPKVSEPPRESVWRDALAAWMISCSERLKTRISAQVPLENPSRYALGTYKIAYFVAEPAKRPSLPELLDFLRESQGHETGWPEWLVTHGGDSPRPIDGGIECWIREMATSGAHSDFWRVVPDGTAFLLRGYQEDFRGDVTPGKCLDAITPIWRIGEAMLHAMRLAMQMDASESPIAFSFEWSGLKGRQLVALGGDRVPFFRRITEQDVVSSFVSVDRATSIDTQLPELVLQALVPLYEIFDFFKMSPNVVAEEIKKLRSGRF